MEDSLEPLPPAHGRTPRRMRLAGGVMGGVGDDAAAVFEVRGEHAVVSGEMGAGAWHEGGEAGDEVRRVEHDMGRPVTEGVLESIHDLAAVIDREAFVRDGRASDVAAKPFEGVPLMGSAPRAGKDRESRELSDGWRPRRMPRPFGARSTCISWATGPTMRANSSHSPRMNIRRIPAARLHPGCAGGQFLPTATPSRKAAQRALRRHARVAGCGPVQGSDSSPTLQSRRGGASPSPPGTAARRTTSSGFPYPQSVVCAIVRELGAVYGPCAGRRFASTTQMDIDTLSHSASKSVSDGRSYRA